MRGFPSEALLFLGCDCVIKYTVSDCTTFKDLPNRRYRMKRKAAKLMKKNMTVFEVFTCEKGPVQGKMEVKK